MKVSDLMETKVTTCDLKADLQEIAQLMLNKGCGSIPVVNGQGKPVGMITDRDVVMTAAVQHKPLWEITAQQVATHQKVFTCHAADSIQTALSIMRTNKIRRLPVVDTAGKLKGILSIDKMINVAKPKSLGDNELAFNDVMTSLKNICSPRQVA